jgi:membrane protein DedA with SNARE-associated domain
LEDLASFITSVLKPLFGEPHFGLFLFVWFSAIFPLAPPEEAFTLLGGACIARGILSVYWGPIAIVGGIITTNVTQYWMGRGVLKLFSGTRLGKHIIRSHSFRRAKDSFYRKGIWAIVGCRFFFGTRAPTYVVTGFLRYNFWKFFAVDSSLAVVHGAAFLVIGYVFHQQIHSLIVLIKQLGIWSLVILVAVIIIFVLLRWYLDKRRDDRELSHQEENTPPVPRDASISRTPMETAPRQP